MEPMMSFQLICVILMVITSILGYISAAQKKKNAKSDKDEKKE